MDFTILEDIMKRCLLLLILLHLFNFIFDTGELYAANPVPADCISLTQYYPRAPESESYHTFTNPLNTYDGYKPFFRVFIPPGTLIEDLNILEFGDLKAVIHHKTPPTGLPDFPPSNYVANNPYLLSELETMDRWAFQKGGGLLPISRDSLTSALPISRAGWLYVKVGSGDTSFVNTQFSAMVDSKVFNEWWDKYIKNEAGWNEYVQNVGEYIDPTKTTAVLSVDPIVRNVTKNAGTTTFEVSNKGTGAMQWNAVVTQGSEWLTIISESIGTNTGTITCSYTVASIVRTGTIQITSDGNSPVNVTVVQDQDGKPIVMPVPATGQTTCYDANGSPILCPVVGQPFFGQDANYQTINKMSYTKLDSSGHDLTDEAPIWSMVRDNVTGLVWEMKTNIDGIKNPVDPHDADNTYTWFLNNSGTSGSQTDTEDFINTLNSDKFGGFKDWRLPTVKELANISNYSIPLVSPVVNQKYFPNTQADLYWSSTPFIINPIQSWAIDFTIGYPNYKTQNNEYYVRAVRGGTVVTSNYEAIANNATVTDKTTGLMWQKDGSVSGDLTWENALKYCEKLNLDGFGGYSTGWRMPTIKELNSLADYNRKNPSINADYFITLNEFYWSSTTLNYENFAGYAWGVDFKDGGPVADEKDALFPVRAVRSVSMLSVSPSNQKVTKDKGSVTFNVLITGTKLLPWEAKIVGTSNWLTKITSTPGAITCDYEANYAAESRTATIQITAAGAELNSPVDVTVTQGMTCTAEKINKQLYIPYITYNTTNSGKSALAADFIQTPNLNLYKLNAVQLLVNPQSTCTPSTLSDEWVIQIPDVIIDGIHWWLELTYRPLISAAQDYYFEATGAKIITN